MWNLVLVCLEMVLASVQDRCMVCAKRTIGLETVSDAPMVLLGDEAQVQAHFSLFRDSTLTQDRCTVCAERTIGSKIVLDAPDETPSCVGHVESRFGPFGDSVSVGAR